MKGVTSGLTLFLPAAYEDAAWVQYYAKKTPSVTVPTHQLIVNVVREFGGSVVSAVIHDYRYQADQYQCDLIVATPNGERSINCRVCDAMAVSLLLEFPVRIDTAFLGDDPIMI